MATEEEGLQALEQEILRVAEERAGEAIAAARARASELLRQAREEGRAQRAQLVAQAHEGAKRERARIAAAARLEARRRRLAAREAIISAVFEAARARLAGELTAAEREAALVKAVFEAALALGGGHLTVQVNARDLALLTPSLRREVEEHLGRQGVAAVLEPGPPAPILGGAIVSKEGGRVVLDNSFDARLERQSWTLRNEVWQALTEEVPEVEMAF